MKKEEFERVDMRIPDYENTQKTQCQVLLQFSGRGSCESGIDL